MKAHKFKLIIKFVIVLAKKNLKSFLFSIFGVIESLNTNCDASTIILSIIRLLGPIIASWGILIMIMYSIIK